MSTNRFSAPPGRLAQALALLVSLAAVFAVAAVGGAATASSVTGWYVALNKPSFNPPNAVFGPVGTVLYIMMAVAAWRVWRRRHPGRRRALALYAVQLALNLAWPLLLFGLHAIGLALVDVVALAILIAATILAFRRIDRPAAALMLPYLAWTLFASALNAALWRLN